MIGTQSLEQSLADSQDACNQEARIRSITRAQTQALLITTLATQEVLWALWQTPNLATLWYSSSSAVVRKSWDLNSCFPYCQSHHSKFCTLKIGSCITLSLVVMLKYLSSFCQCFDESAINAGNLPSLGFFFLNFLLTCRTRIWHFADLADALRLVSRK